MCSWVRRWWKSSGKWEPFLASIVWNPWVPMKMAFFAWKAAWGSILTINQLKRRGQTMLNRCYMYKDEESIDHMLSSKASILWWLYFFFLFLVWLRWSTSIRGTLLSWHGSVGGKKWKKKNWRAFLPVLDFMKVKKQEVFLRCWIVGPSNQNCFDKYLFGMG